ncbi:head decoration protein [Paenibacillus algorifonticola]|uniref:head decoration protein n=1 Tax=Paenibacillus algorifonticola TaxID=684063 RepID=UPI003D2AC468
MPSYESQEYDNLIAGGVKERVETEVIIQSGSGIVTRGTALGRLTGVDSFGLPVTAPVDSTSVDGSGEVYAILSSDMIDATTRSVRAVAYMSGEFNRAAIKFGGVDTIATHETKMRRLGIIIKRVVD